MKIIWLTDIHLNFLESHQRQVFYRKIKTAFFEAIFVTGDIAEANSVETLLLELAEAISKPIYFVLGNHDYYFGQISQVKNQMRALVQKNKFLHYLPSGLINLAHDIFLVGQDGWADGRLGDYENSRVSLNDSHLIADLFEAKMLSRAHLLEKMQVLADADAQKLKCDLQVACCQQPKIVVILTHVPPFRSCCLYEDKISDDNYLPFFSAKATGDVLIEMAEAHPNIEFLVFAGHTHYAAKYQAQKNLFVRVGRAEYYKPGFEIIDV